MCWSCETIRTGREVLRDGQTAILVRWSAVRCPVDYRNDRGPVDRKKSGPALADYRN